MMTMLGRTRRVHFVGVGGIGMSGIAELLANLGYEVSGSDRRRSETTDRLAELGIRIAIGHDAAHLGAADVVVTSSAVGTDNPEVAAARVMHIPVIPRAEMLAEFMRLRTGIAIAGAHGKTTTTSMIALMLEKAGLDPTAVIGGRLSAFGSNARLGSSQYMVAEADESDRSFLLLSPTFAVITNIDREHMESYESFDHLIDAFVAFGNKVPFYGAIIACIDDPVVAALLPRLTRRVITYGLSEAADVRGEGATSDGRTARCMVRTYTGLDRQVAERAELVIGVPGRHNILNALGAAAMGRELGVPFAQMAEALHGFHGAERRYQLRGVVAGVTVVDDYGHHPTEIAAVLRTAREGSPGRLVAAFQPHRYSRTRDLLADFGPALGLADVVVLTDIYAAGEAPIPGVSLEALAAAVRPHVKALVIVPAVGDVAAHVAHLAEAGDLVVTLGAGSIGHVADRIVALLQQLASSTAETSASGRRS
jgi:UDP-N-acetylmuramate--alanine ligase